MSDAVIIAIITACGAVPTSVVGFAAAYFSYKASSNSRQALEVGRKTEKNTNGMTEALVRLTAKSSHARGVLEGRKARRPKVKK